ncbi:lipoprotein [Streptomyces fructofermentans]|uniref:Lipoprotein n=2 Tax=Streptomyces fructofermentans TaxID=152141 RepID=A0A918KLP9_9ACTN|nr:lipoprotein [Streptomyces fructofermentans]
MTRHGFALVAGAAVLALSGCGSDGGTDDKVPATATGSLEHLAAEVKCKPDIQTDADEIRQAICKNADGKFILATFATDRGQREWLNGAKDYGGHYLVGAKWVAVGETKVVTALRGRLGGTVEEGTDHGGSDHGATHSGHDG